MFEKNKQLQQAIDTLYENLKDEEYGKKISWNKLKALAGNESLSKDNLYYVANKVCLMLMRNNQRYLETVRKAGKRIINPDEHQLVAKKKVNKSVRIYRNAGAILASTNMDELTEEQKQQVIESANKYSTLEMFTLEMLKKKKIGKSNKEDVRTASLFLDAIKMFAGK